MDLKSFAITLIGFFAIGSVSSQNAIQLPCLFQQTYRGYTCRLPDINLGIHDNFEVIAGPHLPGMNNNNVAYFLSVNNQMLRFPTEIFTVFPQLRHVKVSGSSLSSLTQFEFMGLPNLLSLILSNNEIEQVHARAFASLTSLQELSLRFNRVRFLNETIFSTLSGLQRVDLAFNLLERLNSLLFSWNQALNHIDLSGNRIRFMGATIFTAPAALTTLDFLSNLCMSGSWTGLNTPAIRNQMQEQLAPCFIDGPREFMCEFILHAIDGEVHYECTLRNIELYDEQQVVTITGVHLPGRNNGDVTFVQILGGNVQFIITQIFTTFSNLQGLNINACNLLNIQPNAFLNANNLIVIAIAGNPFSTLVANSFNHLPSLLGLVLWSNSLESINENAFSGMPRLVELNVHHSYISNLAPNTFNALTSLRLVKFSENQLSIIDSRWFVNNREIQSLIFNSNQINAISPTILEDLPQLELLELQNNICANTMLNIINTETRENARQVLLPCFNNYPARLRRIIMDVEGGFSILYNNRTQIIRF